MKKLIKLITELRESAGIQYKIFTEGSCFKLYRIIKVVYPSAVPYWSDLDNHCITEVNGRFFDIGGEVKASHILDRSYFKIPNEQLKGYSLLKWQADGHRYSVKIEKYVS